jgi:hypothetical protein
MAAAQKLMLEYFKNTKQWGVVSGVAGFWRHERRGRKKMIRGW